MPMPKGKSMISVYCSASLKDEAPQKEILRQSSEIFIQVLGRLRPGADKEWLKALLATNKLGNQFMMEMVNRYGK